MSRREEAVGQPDRFRDRLRRSVVKEPQLKPREFCRAQHARTDVAAAADDEAREKLLAAPIAGMPLEMMVKGTRAALEACLA